MADASREGIDEHDLRSVADPLDASRRSWLAELAEY